MPTSDRRPTLAEDRAGTDIKAHPEFRGDLLRGDEGVARLQGVFASSHQVKNDEMALQTHNLYFEFSHDPGGRGNWEPSGWVKCDAGYWTHLVGEVGIFLPMDLLVEVCTLIYNQHPEYRRSCLRGSCPTAGVCPPMRVFMAYAVEASERRLTGP